MSARNWLISAAVLLGLCVLNASLGDSVAEAQAAADHAAETKSAMANRAQMQTLERRAHTLLALDNLK